MPIGLEMSVIIDQYLESVAIAWSSKKQPIVVLSSTEAEHKGATTATCDVIWLKSLVKDLQVEAVDPTPSYFENLNNIQLAKNLAFHSHQAHRNALSLRA